MCCAGRCTGPRKRHEDLAANPRWLPLELGRTTRATELPAPVHGEPVARSATLAARHRALTASDSGLPAGCTSSAVAHCISLVIRGPSPATANALTARRARLPVSSEYQVASPERLCASYARAVARHKPLTARRSHLSARLLDLPPNAEALPAGRGHESPRNEAWTARSFASSAGHALL